jgi:5-methylthioribose kinase
VIPTPCNINCRQFSQLITTMPITTESELRQFLSSKDVPCHEVQVLSGGTANFCWRIKTLLGRSSIIKHAEPYVRSNESLAFPTERMDYEHLALRVMPKLLSRHDYIYIPSVFHYFPEEHGIAQ